jgi:hypothetical protein
VLELEDRIREWANRQVDVEPVTGPEVRRRVAQEGSGRTWWRSPRPLAVAAIVLVAALAIGMVIVPSDGSDDVAVVDEPGAGSSVLDGVPRSAGFVTVSDYEQARRSLSIERPSPDGSAEAADEYAEAVASVGVDPREALRPGTPASAAAWRQEFGVDVTLFDQAISFGEPPNTVTIIRGRFDAAQVDAALRADEIWSDLLRTDTHLGVSYYVWGSGQFTPDLPRRTELRPLGEGGALAVVDGRLIRARSVADLRAVLDVLRGDAPGLSDTSGVTAAADHITLLTAAWYLGAPDENGVVIASRNPAEPDDTSYIFAAVPDGVSVEAATARVRDRLTAAGYETADVSVDGDIVVVALALGDGNLMREALDAVPDVITAALADA